MILDYLFFIVQCFLGTTVAAPSHIAVSNMNNANENIFYITHLPVKRSHFGAKTNYKMHV
jgi:hypothetical protein